MSRFGIMTCDQTIRFGDLAIYVTRIKSFSKKNREKKTWKYNHEMAYAWFWERRAINLGLISNEEIRGFFLNKNLKLFWMFLLQYKSTEWFLCDDQIDLKSWGKACPESPSTWNVSDLIPILKQAEKNLNS